MTGDLRTTHSLYSLCAFTGKHFRLSDERSDRKDLVPQVDAHAMLPKIAVALTGPGSCLLVIQKEHRRATSLHAISLGPHISYASPECTVASTVSDTLSICILCHFAGRIACAYIAAIVDRNVVACSLVIVAYIISTVSARWRWSRSGCTSWWSRYCCGSANH